MRFKLFCFCLFFALGCLPGSGRAADVTLAWDANNEPDIAGYRVYYGTASRNYPYHVPVGNFTSCTISALSTGSTYFFSVTAYDNSGHESAFSEEISYTVPFVDTDTDGIPDDQDAFPQDRGEWLDSDGDGIGDNADVDDDNDGMPDTWEMQYELNPLGDDAAADADSDGISNLAEYRAGSNPRLSPTDSPPQPPTLYLPANGQWVGLTPELQLQDFNDPDFGDAHARTRWRILRRSDNACVLDVTSAAFLTLFKVPAPILDPGTAYRWQARFYDSHGSPSSWSPLFSFHTEASGDDSDGNGVPDNQEVTAAADLDADGIPDIEQAGIRCVQAGAVPAQIGISVKGSSTVQKITALASEDPDQPCLAAAAAVKPGHLPFGLIDFKLAVKKAGYPARVTVYLSEPAPPGARWYKYDALQRQWLDFSAQATISADRKSIQLSLLDGGPGDADGAANGIIVDPAGLVVPPDTGSSGSGGNAACFISTAAAASAVTPPPGARWYEKIWPLLLLLPALLIAARRRTITTWHKAQGSKPWN